MHIPDGFLSLPVLISTGAVSLSVLYPAVKKVEKAINSDRVPIMGLSAAFVFTAQLLSFPVFGGTSVHLTGAVLISIILGPLSGILITTSTVLMQAFLFQHGGLLTSGANVLNIAIIQSLFGYYIFKAFFVRRFVTGAFIAPFVAVIFASVICAVELIISGIIPLKTGMTAMVVSHIFAGIGEGLITLLIVRMIKKLKPGLLELKKI